MKNYFYFISLVLGLLSSGCGVQLASLAALPDIDQFPLHRQYAPLPAEPVCRVAVLPFVNDSNYPLAGAIFGDIFAAQFQASGSYLVLQQGDILKIYQQLQILPGVVPSLEEMLIIADRVNAQVLITGVVLEMVENPGGGVKIIAEVQIRDGDSGETLWSTFHRRMGSDYTLTMHFGTIYSAAGLSKQISQEIIKLWLEKGFSQCNETS